MAMKNPEPTACEKCGYCPTDPYSTELFWNKKRRGTIEDWMFNEGVLQCRDEKNCRRRRKKAKK